ncbi:MAG: acyl--CoA ligase [Eubacterium sp.]|nr:acyl--CoA ligase [Eubacterium sp.]
MEKEYTGYPSIDRPWEKYYTKEQLNTSLPEMTLWQNIYSNNKDYPNDIAINYFGNKITYKSLFENVNWCAMALKNFGIKKGECVTLCTSSTPEAVIVVLACNKIGALANFLNPLFSEESMKNLLKKAESKIIFVLDRLLENTEKVFDELNIETKVIIPVNNSMKYPLKFIAGIKRKNPIRKFSEQNYLSWNDFIMEGKNYPEREFDDLEVKYKKDYPAIMVYSSGTTGEPKGIVLTNDGINATIAHSKDTSHQHKRGDTFLQMIPIWFSTGIVLSMMMPLTMGITVILEPVFSKENFAKGLAKFKPNMTLGATSLWRYAIHSKKMKKIDFSKMTFPMSGGEAIREQDGKEIKKFLLNHGCTATFFVGYGMCELGSQVTSSTVLYQGKEGSAGIPILRSRVSSFDINTNEELTYGQRGEIRVDSPAKMKEYFKKPEATEEYFYTDKNGTKWGCTGDIGYVDEDGDVFILGRESDHFITEEGKKVYNFDIENVVLKDERISACKALGITINGKVTPVVHILLGEGAEDSFEVIIRDIDKNCKAQLPEYAVPVAYKKRESFPVHPNGKRDVDSLMEEREGLIDEWG